MGSATVFDPLGWNEMHLKQKNAWCSQDGISLVFKSCGRQLNLVSPTCQIMHRFTPVMTVVELSPNSITLTSPKLARGSFREVGIMETGLKGTSRVCQRRHGEVGIVMEFGLYSGWHGDCEACCYSGLCYSGVHGDSEACCYPGLCYSGVHCDSEACWYPGSASPLWLNFTASTQTQERHLCRPNWGVFARPHDFCTGMLSLHCTIVHPHVALLRCNRFASV